MVTHEYKNEQSPKKDNFMIIAWLQHFAETVGDYMPTEQAIVLPYPNLREFIWSTSKKCKEEMRLIAATPMLADFSVKRFQISNLFGAKATLCVVKYVLLTNTGF